MAPQAQLTGAGIDAAARPAELVIDETSFAPRHTGADAEPAANGAPAGEGGGEPLITPRTGGAIKGFKHLDMDRQEEQEIKELALQRRR